VVELRAFKGHRIESGLFDDIQKILDSLRNRARSGWTTYTSLNRPTPREAPNAFGRPALRDGDIAVATRLPFDFDPDRPTGQPSTDRELALAISARDRFVRMMTARGWPAPALGMSGNGAHAVYRVCVENDENWRHAIDVIYRGAKQLLNLQGVKFDTAVRNPGRIWRAYGTLNRKGEATPERPHRRATIAIPASGWHVVTPRQLEHTCHHWRPREPPRRPAAKVVALRDGQGDYRTLDVARWFRAHQHYRRELTGGKHAVLCPWHGEHSERGGHRSTESVIWEAAGGWPTFHCSHAHCEGRTIRDVIGLWGDADSFCSSTWEGCRRA
jgi:hypothetical protein